MLKPVDYYIDLGTANTLIYAKNRGFVLNEPSVFALRRHNNRSDIFGIGHEAKAMLGKNPMNIDVQRPLREGVIANFDQTAQMLHSFISKIKENTFWFRPRMIISLPCKVTHFEKRAVEEVGYSLGAGKIQLLDEPMAAAIGSGMSVLNNHGQMIVDIGGGTSEIAVISLGGIIVSEAVRIGGDNIDQAIIQHMQMQHNFIIGEQTAEKIKMTVGSALQTTEKSVEIGGFNTATGLPTRLTVTSSMIYPAVDSVVREIIHSIRKTLEVVPPEISGDIADHGIVLTGGGALIDGLKTRVQKEVGVPVEIAKDPLFSVAMGGAKALEDTRLFDAIERPR